MIASFLKAIISNPEQIESYFSKPDRLPFSQLFQHYPILSPLYSKAEADFHAEPFVHYSQRTWPLLPLALCAAYGLFIVAGRYVMRDRARYNLRTPLAYWNLSLSIFSFCGMLRTMPQLLFNITHMPIKDTICANPATTYGEGACGFWTMLFIFSKVPELGDTVWIVLRKSHLHFLHWYHHITVLLFCWHSYAVTSSTGLYFVAMNYSVHAIMYGYYYLAAIKAWPKWISPSFITIAQISQMVVGVIICCASFHYMRVDPECQVKPQNVYAGALMYGSYLYLFVDFFVRRFLLKGRHVKKVD